MLFEEILTFDDSNSNPDVIECIDDSTGCVINCINTDVCKSKHVHCHRTSTNSMCKINLTAAYGAPSASIYTHQSPLST